MMLVSAMEKRAGRQYVVWYDKTTVVFLPYLLLREETHKDRRRSHGAYKKRQAELWKLVGERIEYAFISSNAFSGPDDVCAVCGQQATFRCSDCGPLARFCESCCMSEHSRSRQLHIPERWLDGYFSPAPLMNTEILLSHQCSTVFKERLTIVDLKGYSSDNCGPVVIK